MAIFMNLRMNGDLIKGNVTEGDHVDWIECHGLSWGMALESRQGVTPNVSEVTITKNLDEASPRLFDCACRNVTGECKIHLTKAGEGAEVTTEYELKDCKIVKFSQTNGTDTRDESISLSFSMLSLLIIAI